VKNQLNHIRMNHDEDNKPLWDWLPFICETCGKLFKYHRTVIQNRLRNDRPLPKYCSRECSVIAARQRAKNQGERMKERETKERGMKK